MVAPGSASFATAVTFASVTGERRFVGALRAPALRAAAGVDAVVVVVAAIDPVDEPEPLAAEASP
jgi:hypothetical protein